ncbi:hypothetical protein AMATHDRAFT_55281, partial [Amanita thiersii Skay4041]
MSALLGVTSYTTGLLPLFFSSKSTLQQFAVLGTGLLLGTALGVIIPEGIEMLVESRRDNKDHLASSIALPLILGFILMFLMEKATSEHPHTKPIPLENPKLSSLPVHRNNEHPSSGIEFDAELRELEHDQSGTNGNNENTRHSQVAAGSTVMSGDDIIIARRHANSLTFGLLLHGLADGLALGVSSVSSASTSLSLVVFIALAVHKAPTSLALGSSLASTGLPREECRKLLLLFASSTPIGSILSYFFFSFFGNENTEWAALALLVSGGSFLYVATVLQSVSVTTSTSEMTGMSRVLHVIAGMFIPYALNAIVGH